MWNPPSRNTTRKISTMLNIETNVPGRVDKNMGATGVNCHAMDPDGWPQSSSPYFRLRTQCLGHCGTWWCGTSSIVSNLCLSYAVVCPYQMQRCVCTVLHKLAGMVYGVPVQSPKGQRNDKPTGSTNAGST